MAATWSHPRNTAPGRSAIVEAWHADGAMPRPATFAPATMAPDAPPATSIAAMRATATRPKIDAYDLRYLQYLSKRHADSDLFRDRPEQAARLRALIGAVEQGTTSMGALMDFVWSVQKEDLLATLAAQHPEREITIRPISVLDAAEPIHLLPAPDLEIVARVFASATSSTAEGTARTAYDRDPEFRGLVDRLHDDGAFDGHHWSIDWHLVGRYLYADAYHVAQPGDRQSARRAARLLEGVDEPELCVSGFELRFALHRDESDALYALNYDKRVIVPFTAKDNLQRMLGDVDLRLAAQGPDCVVVRYLPPRAHQALLYSIYGADAARLTAVAGEISSADIVALRDQGKRCVGMPLKRVLHLQDDGSFIHAIDFVGHDIVHGYQESQTTLEARAAVATVFAAHERLPADVQERLRMSSFFNDFAFNFSGREEDELAASGVLINAFSALNIHGPVPGLTPDALRQRLTDAGTFRAALGDGAGRDLIEKALDFVEGKLLAELRRRGELA